MAFSTRSLDVVDGLNHLEIQGGDFVAESDWTIKSYSSVSNQATEYPSFASAGFTNSDLSIYSSRRTQFTDSITGFSLNKKGLRRLHVQFQDLESGQLLGRISNSLDGMSQDPITSFFVSLSPDARALRQLGKSAPRRSTPDGFGAAIAGLLDEQGQQVGGVGTLSMRQGLFTLDLNAVDPLTGATVAASLVLAAD